MHRHDGLARVEEVQQQPKEAYVNVGEVDCGESIAEVARSVFQYGSAEEGREASLQQIAQRPATITAEKLTL